MYVCSAVCLYLSLCLSPCVCLCMSLSLYIFLSPSVSVFSLFLCPLACTSRIVSASGSLYPSGSLRLRFPLVFIVFLCSQLIGDRTSPAPGSREHFKYPFEYGAPHDHSKRCLQYVVNQLSPDHLWNRKAAAAIQDMSQALLQSPDTRGITWVSPFGLGEPLFVRAPSTLPSCLFLVSLFACRARHRPPRIFSGCFPFLFVLLFVLHECILLSLSPDQVQDLGVPPPL